jgi:hypothetical protein
MLVFMPEKIFDLLFTLPRGGTRLNIHVHLLVISVAKVSPSLPRSAAIIRIPQPPVRSIRACCPTLIFRRERSSHPDTTGSDPLQNRSILLPALDTDASPRKPALADFVMAKLDRFAN